MIRTFLVSIALLLSLLSIGHAEPILFYLSEGDIHDVTLLQGDTLRDTLIIVNDVGASTLTSITMPSNPAVHLTLFKSTPLSLKGGWNPIGILTFTASDYEIMFVGYKKGNATQDVQNDLRVRAFAPPSQCVSFAHSNMSRSGVIPYQSVNLYTHVANYNEVTVWLDSVTIDGADASYFQLQTPGLPTDLWQNAGVDPKLTFFTKELSARTYTATLHAYPRRCTRVDTVVSVTTVTPDTAYDPRKDSIWFVTNSDSIVRRVYFRNDSSAPALIVSMYMTGDSISSFPFRILDTSFSARTIVLQDTTGWRDTVLGYYVQPNEEVWVDLVFKPSAREVLYQATLYASPINVAPWKLFGIATAKIADVAERTQQPLTQTLHVTYDARGIAHVELANFGRGTLTLFDLLGRTIREFAPASSWSLDGVPSGHYIARYSEFGAGVVSCKVICE